MEITKITPIRRTWTDGAPSEFIEKFELLFDDGSAVYIDERPLLSYRGVQQAVLRQLGRLFTYADAEKRRDSATAWREAVGRLLQPPETVPGFTSDQRGHQTRITSLSDWRRQQRETEAGAA